MLLTTRKRDLIQLDPFFQLKREKKGERPSFGISTGESRSFAREPHSLSVPSWREFVVSFQALLDCFSCQNYIFAIICLSSKIYWKKGNIWMRFETTSFSPVRKVIPNLQINAGMWFPVFSLHMSSQTPNRSNIRGHFFPPQIKRLHWWTLPRMIQTFIHIMPSFALPTEIQADWHRNRETGWWYQTIPALSISAISAVKWNKSIMTNLGIELYGWRTATFWPL